MGSSSGAGAGQGQLGQPQDDGSPPPVVRPCTACWIEVELRDEEENPVANEPYWIKLADGTLREGRLNKDGFVRLDKIPCGVCTVRFPKYDAADVQWQMAQPGGSTDWVEINLVDTAGRPVPDAPYSIQLPDGRMQAGKLDKSGKARLEGIPRGDCKVRFPEIDVSDFVNG